MKKETITVYHLEDGIINGQSLKKAYITSDDKIYSDYEEACQHEYDVAFDKINNLIDVWLRPYNQETLADFILNRSDKFKAILSNL